MITSALLVLLVQSAAPEHQEKADSLSEATTESAAIPMEPVESEELLVLPKGLQLLITVEGQVGSKISARKDFFPIKLAHPVTVDGKLVLPAGITGEGQVVHAKKGGFAGSAGELLLAARYLEHAGQKIALRSFKFVAEDDEFPQLGKDNSGVAMAVTVFAAPLGFLIGGGNTIIEPGTLATAKLREEIRIQPAQVEQTNSSREDTIINDTENKGTKDE